MYKRNNDLQARTKDFALRNIQLYTSLPKTAETQVIGKQVLRSGTSVGAHYREGTRARSKKEFISKLEVGIQDLNETSYWPELLAESGIVPQEKLSDLLDEANQLMSILTASVKTAKSRS